MRQLYKTIYDSMSKSVYVLTVIAELLSAAARLGAKLLKTGVSVRGVEAAVAVRIMRPRSHKSTQLKIHIRCK